MTKRTTIRVLAAVLAAGQLMLVGCENDAKTKPPTAVATDKRDVEFYSLVGDNIVAADEFRRPDQTSLNDYDQPTPIGGLYWLPTGQNDLHPIVNHRYQPIITPTQAAYARLFVPNGYDAIGGRFVMVRNGTTRRMNAVIGSGAKTFGTNGDGGSIQLATWDEPIMYAPRIRLEDEPDIVFPPRLIQWLAFQVEDPVEDPYVPVYDDLAGWLEGERDPDELHGAYGLFEDGFALEADTEYLEVMRKVDDETVALVLPDGQSLSFRDPVAVGRWGAMGAIQTRRGAETDGTVAWTGIAIATSAATSQPTPLRSSWESAGDVVRP